MTAPLRRMVWIDLETTGLDPDKDVILEVAVVVTSLLAAHPSVGVAPHYYEFGAESWVVKPRNGLPPLHPAVLEMHSKNGLLGELHNGDAIGEVDVMAAGMVHALEGVGGPIAGSTPSFDKRFLDRQMPLLAACFNHRCFDVSTLKQAYAQEHAESWIDLPQETEHRALADIRYSISVARRVVIHERT